MAQGGIDDAVLVRAAQSEIEAFAPLYDRYARLVFRWMARETGDAEAAADLTAQTFIQAMHGLKNYDPTRGATFRGWLFAIARNLLRDTWRRHQPVNLPPETRDHRPGPEETAIQRTRLDEIRAALSTLPERQRDIVELRLSGLETREIAALLGISEEAVRMSQSRAFRSLRALLGDEGER